MTGRLETCKDLLKKNKISSFLVGDFYNVGYLSGFWPLTPKEREVFLLLTSREFFLLTDGRYINQAKALKTGFNCLEVFAEQNFFQTIGSLCQKLKIKKLAFEKSNLTVAEYEKLKKSTRPAKLSPTQNLIEEKRSIKDHQELTFIKNACQIADQTFNHILGFLKSGLCDLRKRGRR